jgi:hypothetical protein
VEAVALVQKSNHPIIRKNVSAKAALMLSFSVSKLARLSTA